MSRVFTVTFPYKEKGCTALVSLKEEGYDLSFMVRYFDKELNALLPGGKLVFSLSEGIKTAAGIPEDLVCCTSEAIAGYLRVHHD